METLLIVLILVIAVILLLFVFRRRDYLPDKFLQQLKDVAQVNSQVRILLDEQGQLRNLIHMLSTQVVGIESRLKDSSSKIKEDLIQDFHESRIILEGLKTEYQARKKIEEEAQSITRSIYETLIGARQRGLSGENILRESFSKFPQDIIEYDFRVRGKVVEYALVLPNKKRIPIDSKWPAQELVERWNKEQDATAKERIFSDIEKKVLAKVKEATGYIDPSATINQAIVPLPDSVFSLLRKAHIEAQRENVVLVPYSMCLPYILTIYSFYLKHLQSIDLEELDNYFSKIDKDIDKLKIILENSISKAATMVKNAYDESNNILGKMKADISLLKRYSFKEDALGDKSNTQCPQS